MVTFGSKPLNDTLAGQRLSPPRNIAIACRNEERGCGIDILASITLFNAPQQNRYHHNNQCKNHL